ncbi:MAG: efflux RND transporter periplasmic adaptor subunit [Candidatus Omnitrophica bacterium]|nr:efflux RND transporter periplasmic adaptor subunit [Candidatus Omnitrophota bacterium]
MKLNFKIKPQWLIGGFLVFWIVFIAWGMIKTSLKLNKEKALPAMPAKLKSPSGFPGAEKGAPAPGQTQITEVRTQDITSQEQEQRFSLVRAFKVKPVHFQDLLPVMGSVKGKTEITLKFEINGVVSKINFREGEKIKKGDLVASIDPKDAQLRAKYAADKFNSAQAGYRSIQKKLEIQRQLFEAGAIIKSKLEEAELESESARYQLEQSRSEMDLAENELKKANIYATKDGVMGPREAEEGEFVTPQDKIGSVFEINEIFVEAGVVERDIEKIKLGQKARVFVDAYPSVVFEGTLDYIFPVIEGKSRTLTVKIKVLNPEGLLLPGMFSRAEISIADLQDALMVPITCLINKGGVIYAPVIPAQSLLKKEEDDNPIGVVQIRKVTMGYKTSDYAEIKAGVSTDDLVVLEVQGEGEFKDNARVKVVGIEEMSI